MDKVMRGRRLRPYNVLAVSVALYLYPLDAVPHVVRSDHAPKGSSMKLVIPVPKLAFMPVRYSVISVITRFRSRNWLIKRVLECDCLVTETRLRGPTHNILQNKGVNWQSYGAINT